MRKFFSFRSSSSSGNDNLPPADLNKSRKKVNSGAAKELNAKISTQERIYDGFQTPEDYVLKPLNQNLENESSSNSYLRRSLSLTSAAICSLLNEGNLSSSSDQSKMTSCRDQHVGRYTLHSQNSFTADRYARAERENEENELQVSLENELVRRSNDWSLKLSKFQAEEQRLRDRVRELAEQNVSLQREIFLFQRSEVETKNNVINLERQFNESRASQDELAAKNLNLHQALTIVSTSLEEKESIQESKCICQKVEIDSSNHQKAHRSEDDMEVELKTEAITTLLREKIYSSELKIEQLQTYLASSVRRCDLLSTDIQRLKDEVSCLNHKNREIEIQMLKKDENILLLQQDLEESTKDLTATRSRLKNVSEERDHIWEEMKQLREKNMIMDAELKSLHKKIELLDEDVLYKDGQISILKDSLRRGTRH